MLSACGSESTQLAAHEYGGARITIVSLKPPENDTVVIAGIKLGLAELSFKENKNLHINYLYASDSLAEQLAKLDDQGESLIITLRTPCLIAAIKSVKKTDVVFANVTDPIGAGAGTSPNEHLSNFTGLASMPPIRDALQFALNIKPGASLIATCYNPREPNSVLAIKIAYGFLTNRYVRFHAEPITPDSDISEVLHKLALMNPDAIWLPDDNTVSAQLDSALPAFKEPIPIILNTLRSVPAGAIAGFGIDDSIIGYATGRMAAHVINGVSPADIPFGNSTQRNTLMNYEKALSIGIQIPSYLGDGVKWTGSPPPPVEY
ncbi:MAG: ABC transporter substrate-binding protein [Candidatus Lindowbacteria bacterium]|nr:ABC transporter substrate-binding protein [Candidatus Lindowbacteria bacterium]